MKENQIKLARDVVMLLLAIAFFILGTIFTCVVVMDSAILTGCIIILLSLAIMIVSLFDIGLRRNAINVIREEEYKKNTFAAREEQRMLLLEKYKKLQADGIISEEEFAAKKSAIMRDMMRK